MSSNPDESHSPLRRWSGPLTRDLVQSPGAFGLGRVPARLKPDATTSMVCGYCSTGCGLNIHLREGRAINLTPTTEYPVNLGMACPKGWEALTPLDAPDRARIPLYRNPRGQFEPVTWHLAMTEFVRRFKTIQQRSGEDSIAWLGTGQICTEELALLGAFAKFGMGMIHGDGNTRQCMATSVVAYKESFGFDAPPFTYQDLEESNVLVLVGSNLAIAHPILWQRALRNRNHPEIVVIDPRRTETAMAATQHYPLRAKSDLWLLYGLAHQMIVRGWIDREFIDSHTTGLSEFVEFAANFPLERVAAETCLPREQIEHLAATIHQGQRVSFWWTMGVNQGHEAVRTAQAIINLALMTGNLGRPGTGANSITGQCNAMGSRLFSNTTNLLGGHEFTNAIHRRKVAQILGIPVERIPHRDSWAYDQILDGIAAGVIRGLWIVGTNTAHSWIDQKRFQELRSKLEFLVVQDMYPTTETAQAADLILPAAGWGEKEGTFINSERRIGRVKQVARSPGASLSDFRIFHLIAHYWGCADWFAPWSSPEAAFQILKQLSRGQPCDFTGIRDYQMLDECGGIQWPCPEHSTAPEETMPHGSPEIRIGTGRIPAQERRLFEDGRFYHSDGKARFIFEFPHSVPEPVDPDFPFLLLTGRGSSAQWHTQTRTGKSDLLRQLSPQEIYVEINPVDAGPLGIAPNDLVRIISRRGEISATAFLTPTVLPGNVFIPMHYAATNQLTAPALDPYSRQPSYKATAVSLLKPARQSNVTAEG